MKNTVTRTRLSLRTASTEDLQDELRQHYEDCFVPGARARDLDVLVLEILRRLADLREHEKDNLSDVRRRLIAAEREVRAATDALDRAREAFRALSNRVSDVEARPAKGEAA